MAAALARGTRITGTERQELAVPPSITFAQTKGFTLWATRSVLSGNGDEVLDVAKANLRQLSLE